MNHDGCKDGLSPIQRLFQEGKCRKATCTVAALARAKVEREKRDLPTSVADRRYVGNLFFGGTARDPGEEVLTKERLLAVRNELTKDRIKHSLARELAEQTALRGMMERGPAQGIARGLGNAGGGIVYDPASGPDRTGMTMIRPGAIHAVRDDPVYRRWEPMIHQGNLENKMCDPGPAPPPGWDDMTGMEILRERIRPWLAGVKIPKRIQVRLA